MSEIYKPKTGEVGEDREKKQADFFKKYGFDQDEVLQRAAEFYAEDTGGKSYNPQQKNLFAQVSIGKALDEFLARKREELAKKDEEVALLFRIDVKEKEMLKKDSEIIDYVISLAE